VSEVQISSARSFGSQPEAPTRQLLDTVSVYTNRLEDGAGPGHKIISAGLAPKAADRAAMEDRRRHLRDCLTATNSSEEQKALRLVVSALLGAFPVYGVSTEQADATVRMIVRALDDVPVWFVQRAAGNFLKGRQKVAWNPEKAPTPPQIRAEAMLAVLDVETELHRLSQVLDAELVDNDTTEDERAAALAHWAQIRAGIASTNIINDRTDEEISRERSEMQRANERVRARETKAKAQSVENQESAV
jgi:hypothetical protein